MSDSPPRPPIHLPKQARSRETLSRLLDAAEAVLAEGGLDAATVPAIAKRAGLSVGVVYRRFPDKDALLRAVYFRYFERMQEQNVERLAPERWRAVPLPTALEMVIRGIVHGYREHGTLLGALLRYAETHPDPEFRCTSDRMNSATLDRMAEMVLAKREGIRHPDPESAIRFGLLMVGLVLKGVLLTDPAPAPIFLREGVSLEEELTRMVLGYLGVERA